ncbi:sensor histidine kinase [Clavibacter californiensis]|uniref:Histidine kinase n=1 Tax=Clavibacter californiensis TaxID=1401995 RepID=A0ABX9N6H1_9MICO|nr:ATP-binding protein [Clavibacter californiensis]RII92751.1 histidine kinase [Clavibacter californiensis]UKF81400.1 histidine kinase [Clavibacter californiensis]
MPARPPASAPHPAAPATRALAGAPPRTPDNPISLARIETILGRGAGAFGLLFALQSVQVITGQLDTMRPAWSIAFLTVFFGSLVWTCVAGVIRRGVVPAHATVAIVFVLALATWPFAIAPDTLSPVPQPFLYQELTVATTCAAMAFRLWIAVIYTVAVPLGLGVIEAVIRHGTITPLDAFLQVLYSIILGGSVLMIVTVLRQAALGVDWAQGTALTRYSHAVRQHATEVERVQVDAIVHDSVLTTLLSAARTADPAARTLAATMAANAMGHLAAAEQGTDDDASVPLRAVAKRIVDAASALSAPFVLETRDLGARTVPVATAEAIYSAAVQAMMNSLQHAGTSAEAITRTLVISGHGDEGVAIDVVDDGVGFDQRRIPTERLGLRVSIKERVAQAGGLVTIDSAPGEGTAVRIRWPAPADAAAPEAPLLPGDLDASPTERPDRERGDR